METQESGGGKGEVIIMSNFERKFGKYAIKNISMMLILCYILGYIIELLMPEVLYFLTLNPYAIVHGQIWRVATWILIPPGSDNLFFTLIMLYFYYSLGTTLERTWGTYNMSIFLAFAATFPEAQVLLMFVIPVKVKVLGIIYGILLLVSFIQGNTYSRFAMAASLFNFIVFWATSRSHIHMSPRQVKRQQEFKREVKRSTGSSKHKCAICGRTEKDSPDLEFRYCSKCEGNYEYCKEHLFTHQHVKY